MYIYRTSYTCELEVKGAKPKFPKHKARGPIIRS